MSDDELEALEFFALFLIHQNRPRFPHFSAAMLNISAPKRSNFSSCQLTAGKLGSLSSETLGRWVEWLSPLIPNQQAARREMSVESGKHFPSALGLVSNIIRVGRALKMMTTCISPRVMQLCCRLTATCFLFSPLSPHTRRCQLKLCLFGADTFPAC
jgi:hypothetical protein